MVTYAEAVSYVAVLDVVVAVFGIVMGTSSLFQLARIVRRRHSDDVSLPMMLIMVLGSLLWLLYGLAHDLPAVICANAVGLTCYILTCLAVLRFRRPGGHDDAHDVARDIYYD